VAPIGTLAKKEPTLTKRKRRHYDANFKSRVALEAIKELKTLAELSSEFGVHANQIRHWKNEFLEKASLVFRSGPRKSDSRLSEIPEVDYPTTREKNEAKETKSFTGIQGKSSVGSHKRRFHVGSAFRAI